MLSNLEYIYSQRGRPLIVIDGYLYRKNRDAYWRCIRCTKFKCKSRLILRPGRDPVCIESHSHGPEHEKIEWGRKINDLRTSKKLKYAVELEDSVEEEVEPSPAAEAVVYVERQPDSE